MTTRRRQLALAAALCIPVLSRALISASVVVVEPKPTVRLQSAGAPVSPTNPILFDTNGDGVPTPGVDTPAPLTRAGNVVTLRGPLDCNPHDTDNQFTLGNPNANGVFQRVSRINDMGATQQVDTQGFFLGRPDTFGYSETDLDGAPKGSGFLAFQDRNGDRIADTIFASGATRHNTEVGVSVSLVGVDTTGDENPDFMSVPWAQASAFGVEPNDGCQAPGQGGTDPQVWIPLADTDADGVPDSVAFDLDGNGVPDPDLFLGPKLAQGAANLPALSLPADHQVSEGAATLPVTVTLTPASLAVVTVDYATAPLTAAAPSDYTHTTGTLTFNPGDTSKTFQVPIADDPVFEGLEHFAVALSNPVNAAFTQGTSRVALVDNDAGTPGLSVGDASEIEGNTGTKNLRFFATLNAPPQLVTTVQFATSNGAATEGSDYVAATGSLTFNPGETQKPIDIVLNGDTAFEIDEAFRVTLSNATNATIVDPSAFGVIVNDDPPALTITDAAVVEGNAGVTNAVFTVSLTPASQTVVTVQFATAAGTATPGVDYTTTAGTLTFNPGDLGKTISVPVIGDTLFEANETFTVDLSAPTNANIADAQGVGTIANDDPQPVLSINDVTVTEGNAGTTTATFTVSLAGASNLAATVQYATAGGSAAAPGDYTATGGTLTFNPGETTKPIPVSVSGDIVVEPNETFTVNLSAAVNATIADNQGLGTITNDDAASLSVNDVTVPEGNSGSSTATFTVALSNASPVAITVQYATANGTATAGSDYTATAGTLTFNPGETTKSVPVSVRGDIVVEPTETFTLNLSAPVNATIGDTQGVGTITNDDAAKVYPLAEGATGPFFDTNILIANPNAVSVPVTVTFVTPVVPGVDVASDAPSPGVTVTQNLVLGAMSRTTIEVDKIPSLENTAFSTIVTSPDGLPVIVERTMYWDATRYGGHGDGALSEPRTTWYFAEGSQGFFETFLLLGNYGSQLATAIVTYLREGEAPVSRSVAVPAGTRVTLALQTVPELAGRSFSIVVNADQPISAERSMYFGAPRLFEGGHTSSGKGDLSTTWFHAEGATGPFFDTFILVGNPNNVATTLTFTFLLPSGPPVVRQRLLAANSRMTVNVEDVDPLLANTAVSTMIASTLPVVTERSQYWVGPFTSWYEGHSSFGVPALGTEWGLAEGQVGGSLGFETYILLSNPDAVPATVDVTYLRASGAPVLKLYTVPANTRLNVHVNSQVPELANETFGALVRSTNGTPISVDRSMYWSVGGQIWAGGTSVSAARLQ